MTTTTTTHYSKKTIWSFFIILALCALILYILRPTNDTTSSNTAEKDFVEIASEMAEKVIHTASIPIPAPETVIDTAVEESFEFSYIEVTGGCGPYFNEDECLNVRSGPGTQFSVVTQLRNGIVLKIEEKIKNDSGEWYKVVFDEWLRYPDRVAKNWYVSANYVRVFTVDDTKKADEQSPATKRIVVDRTQQTLTAYEGDTVFMEVTISTGRDLTPTPRGTFTIFRKTPSRYMQGPIADIPGSDYYDLPGVPWNLYFTAQGAVIHGTYWHDNFGTQYSHGCVNLPPTTAEKLYHWAELGTTVQVMD